MATLKNEIIEALNGKFSDLNADGLETVRATGYVTGVVVSARFNRLDHKKRQDMLWQVLERALPKAKLAKVGPIATLTPVEAGISVSARL